MIEATGVRLHLGSAEVLAGVDLATRPGRVVGLIGPNGSGKSSLLRCLYGVRRPARGAVLVDGRAVQELPRRAVARAVAVVAQDAVADGTGITVGEYVLLGRHAHRGDHQRFTHDDHRLAVDALTRVAMDHAARRPLQELSGGERQRVMIARCVAQGSPTLLLDEPTNHLDVRFQHEVLALVRRLGLATVVVLHDLNLAGRYCDHLVLLDRGRVVAQGPPAAVLRGEVLEPVYGIEVRCHDDDGHVLLAFGSPRRDDGSEAPVVGAGTVTRP